VVLALVVRVLLLLLTSLCGPQVPLVLLPRQQRKLRSRKPSPSNSLNSPQPLALLPGPISVTQKRRERRAEKIERKRIRKRQSLKGKLSSLVIGDNTISINALSSCTASTPDSKADGLACSGSSATVVSSTITTTTTTTTITTKSTTTISTVSAVSCSDSPPSAPQPSPEVLAFFNGKASFMLRHDFHLYGNITNKFLFAKCIFFCFCRSCYCLSPSFIIFI
jgi:hypothetical protein